MLSAWLVFGEAMSRLMMTGFEGGASSMEQLVVTGSAGAYDTAVVRSGAFSWKWVVSGSFGSYAVYTFTGATAVTYYLRFYLYITTLPASQNIFLATLGAGGGSTVFASLRLHTNGTVHVFDDVSATDLGNVAISSGAWHRLELAVKINTGSNDDYIEAKLDGTTIVSSTTRNLGTTAPNYFDIDAITVSGSNDTFTVAFDDLALNDSQGSSNNSWGGDEKIVLLKPVSDNARGTNWVAGAGGTSNLWDAVNNTPPVGVANASASNTSQVKNATSDTTGNYDADIQTYGAYGIHQTDVINAVQGVWDVGCSSATSTSGATRVVSNPAEGSETSINFSAGGAVGTWASNWKRQFNAIIEKPYVQVDTSPVLRVGKRQATTRIGHCDFMGLMVGYTPMSEQATQVNQAVKRASLF